ncbi:MAG: Hpt domain-containing protein [Flavobacteriales bacterium]|nr:Hpt domain-containing protein [Flavobacteriales bacterium]
MQRKETRTCHIPHLLVLIAYLVAVPVLAQRPSTRAVADSLRVMAHTYRTAIVLADSARDTTAAIQARMDLAAISRSREAEQLLLTAIDLAVAGHRWEEEYRGRHVLVEQLVGLGQWRPAYEQMRWVARMDSARRVDVTGTAKTTVAAMEERTISVRDSLIAASRAARSNAEDRVQQAQEEAELWMCVAWGTIFLALSVLAVVLYKHRRSIGRLEAGIAELRAELNGLVDRSKSRSLDPIPPQPATTAPAPPPPSSVLEEPPTTGKDDPLVLAMFRKLAPERLATLRDARARGDHEKVRRVVYTLKPQLASLDPRIAEVCARITGLEAAEDSEAWNNDLDALIATIERRLGTG